MYIFIIFLLEEKPKILLIYRLFYNKSLFIIILFIKK